MEKLYKLFTRELALVILLITAAVIITNVPYLLGYLLNTSEHVYIGTRLNNSWDFPSYLAWIEQSRDHITLKDLYSSEEQPRLFVHPLFFIIGKAAELFSLSNTLAYHIFKSIGAVFFLLSGYCFIKFLLENQRTRILAFCIFVFGSGLGWLAGNRSVDIIQSEATNFLTIYESLLNTVGLTLVIWIFLLFLRWRETTISWKKITTMGLLIIALALTHTYDLIIVASVLTCATIIFYLIEKNNNIVKLYIYSAMFTLVGTLWQLWVLERNSVLGVWATIQTTVPAQKPLAYLITYGILIILSVAAIPWAVHDKNKKLILPMVWIIIGILLLFNPFTERFQQKLSAGIFIPLSILTGYTVARCIQEVIPNISKRVYGILLIFILLPFSYTNIYVLGRDIEIMRARPTQLFIPTATEQALQFFKSLSQEATIVSGIKIGNLIPGFTGQVVYIGHYDQTVNFQAKYELMQKMVPSIPAFTDPLARFLRNNRITHIVVDNEVRSWGGLVTDNRTYLTKIFDNTEIQIYQVSL